MTDHDLLQLTRKLEWQQRDADKRLRQLIGDAARYAKDARTVARRKLSPENLAVIRARLKAAQVFIAKVLGEIEARLEDKPCTQ